MYIVLNMIIMQINNFSITQKQPINFSAIICVYTEITVYKLPMQISLQFYHACKERR